MRSLYLLIAILLLPSLSSAQIGPNKVRYRSFSWRILETDRFTIHFYPEEERMAREVASIAEESFKHVAPILGYGGKFPLRRIPIFLYKSHSEFEQTNIIPEPIDEGVGGVTEILKNRMVIPISNGSRRWLRHVIRHELTHALQFNMLYGESGWRLVQLYRSVFIPLWILEGMAEFCAGEWTAEDSMVVADAVINDRLKPLWLLDNFGHLDGGDVWLAYKQSHLAISYIVEKFGSDSIPRIMAGLRRRINADTVIRGVTGLSIKELNRRVSAWIRERYWGMVSGKKAPYELGSPLLQNSGDWPIRDRGGAWSPDGKWIAFVSNRSGYDDIFLLPSRGYEGRPRSLLGSKITRSLDWIQISERPISWDPEGKRIAFVGREGGRNHLFLLDLSKPRALKKISLPLDDLSSPAWSPKGDLIAISGLKDGRQNIYIVSEDGGKLKRISSGTYDLLPSFSPDGKWIAFVTEIGGNRHIAVMDLEGKGWVVTSGQHDNTMPMWSKDGNCLLFLSSRDGDFYDLFASDPMGKKVVKVMEVAGGILDPSISPDGTSLSFSTYEDGNQILYVARLPSQAIAEASSDEWRRELPGSPLVWPKEDIGGYVDIPTYPYSFDFSPDLAFGMVYYDSYSGLVGGGYFRGSDMLGNHYLEMYGLFMGGGQNTYDLLYILRKWRADLGIYLYRYSSWYLSSTREVLQEEPYDYESGSVLYMGWPLTPYIRADTYLFRTRALDPEFRPDPFVATGVEIALIRDTRAWDISGPCGGSALGISVQNGWKFLGGERSYVSVEADLRKYMKVGSSVLAGRLWALESFGEDKEVFYLGGANRLRGFGFEELKANGAIGLSGELRIPFGRRVNFIPGPLTFLLFRDVWISIFADTAFLWKDGERIGLNSLKADVGAGITFHIFIDQSYPLIFRIDAAQGIEENRGIKYSFAFGQPF
jgi:hypothetical protein